MWGVNDLRNRCGGSTTLGIDVGGRQPYLRAGGDWDTEEEGTARKGDPNLTHV